MKWKRSPIGGNVWIATDDSGKEVARIYKRRRSYQWEKYNDKNMGSLLHKDNRGEASTLTEAKRAAAS